MRRRDPPIPLIVSDRELGSFRLGLKFGRHSRFEGTLAELKSVLKQFGRLTPKDLASPPR